MLLQRALSDVIKKSMTYIPQINRDLERTWIPPQACQFLKLKHHLHSPFEKSIIIERTIQDIKDRTEEGFDDYFPCRKRTECKLMHVMKWLNLFTHFYNKELRFKRTEPI